jgi:hypothetical protein
MIALSPGRKDFGKTTCAPWLAAMTDFACNAVESWGALLSASLTLRRIDIVKLRWSAQTNLPQTELRLKCLVMLYCESNHPHLQTMHNAVLRESRDDIRQGGDQQQMLDENREIKARQRWHLLVKEGRKRLATAFAEPCGEHKVMRLRKE